MTCKDPFRIAHATTTVDSCEHDTLVCRDGGMVCRECGREF
ncbi:MAG: hypothetical protein ACOCY1_04680 [Halovenus sp.]